MRRSSGLLLFLTGLLVAVCFYALPLAAQRRPTANPFPDDDELGAGGYGHYFSISGTVADRQSGLRLDGVRVDLNSFNRGAVATTFTTQGTIEELNTLMAYYGLHIDEKTSTYDTLPNQ